MKNILAENLLRFGVKNLSEADKSKLNEQQGNLDRRDWANKQQMVIKNLSAEHHAEKWPFTPQICGPYQLFVGASQRDSVTQQTIADGGVYEGFVRGWYNRGGFPSPMAEGECSFFQFDPVNKFKQFEVTQTPIGTRVGYMNAAYNEVPLNVLKAMWANVKQAPEILSSISQFKATVTAYQKNPTDATKGYDKITGNAAEFLKSLKFA